MSTRTTWVGGRAQGHVTACFYILSVMASCPTSVLWDVNSPDRGTERAVFTPDRLQRQEACADVGCQSEAPDEERMSHLLFRPGVESIAGKLHT